MAAHHSDNGLDQFHPDESVAHFAEDLRQLRAAAGEPSLIALESAAGVSKSVLSEAFSGRRLPTENTLRRLVPALGGDTETWLRRRAEADPRQRGTSRAPDEGASSAPGHRSLSLPVTRKTLLTAMAATAVLSSALTLTGAWLLFGPALGSPPTTTAALSASSYETIENGADPMRTECRNDAVLAGGDEYLDGQVLVEMMYSTNCMAVWGRVTRYDGQSSGNEISLKIYPKDDPDGARTQVRTESDVQSIYTKLFLEPNVDARVCGLATITVGDQSFVQPNPVCI